MLPVFPEFKELSLEDREIIRPRLRAYNPQTSELTFVNLYIWRRYYQFSWTLYQRLVGHSRSQRAGQVCITTYWSGIPW